MRSLILCLAILALSGAALANEFRTGAAFRHEDNALKCGTPTNAIVWIGKTRAEQHFQHCNLVATYATVTPIPPPTSTPLPVRTATPFPTPSTIEGQLLTLLNQHRAVYGAPPLSLTADTKTQKHAQDMDSDGTIWHQSANHPDTSFPYDGFVGENVGAAQSVQQIDSLMMGEGTSTCRQGTISHACNIVSPAFSQVALGIAYGPPYGVYLVEDFR